MMTPPPLITLLTDYGDKDSYVGVMKGVVLSIAPHAQLVDITHQIKPQDIQQAALILLSYYRYFPSYTVHVVVVDPGVGGPRRPVALETPHGFFVAPDNGVLTYVWLQEPASEVFLLDKPDYWLPNPSHTFHGRDVFSPVAARLASGTPLKEMGSPIADLITLSLPPLQITPTSIRGEVIRIDRFGNALTNIMQLSWVDDHTVEFRPLSAGSAGAAVYIDARTARVTFGWHTLNGLHQTYSQIAAGQGLALIGSNAELEVAVNQGSAHDKLALKVGDPVTLLFNV